MDRRQSDLIGQNGVVVWIALAVACVLMIPLVAMQFTGEVDWTAGDFIAAGALLFGAGSAFVLAARRLRSRTQRLIAGAALAVVLLYAWAELAVGVFTELGS